MSRELLQQALDALDDGSQFGAYQILVDALRSALAQPEAEPIDGFGGNLDAAFDAPGAKCDGGTCGLGGYCSKCPKQMTTPAVPAVQPLTDEQFNDLVMEHLGPHALTGGRMSVYDAFLLAVRATERAHGIAAPGSAPAAPAVPDGWVMVSERMPASGVVVLACYTNDMGNIRRIRAEWVAAKTQESGGDSDIGEYDEATDTYYDPQGWYERIDCWDDGFSAIGVNHIVTHWMPLPAAPGSKP